jgi:ABC-type sugar transport system ATPase subunit
MRAVAISELKRLKVNMPSVDQWAMRLSGGQRQGIVCAGALMGNTPIMIMDEPTAALGVKESAGVIELVNKCREDGAAVLLISHNMREVFAMAQRITVLRLGSVVCEGLPTKTLTEEEVVGLITGAIECAAPRA